ncbi:transient receptor potential cation channel subfamily A member 1 homolog isoform X3 [Ruditapes philippinarum]|uniref:transient receptor potential cation channel subfamily A member 1 homolog isoform X3 n=1 Tax=Ruditapes philippinarum TaxID=129788 RepID=UPI00295AA442|nr:transient receptor potential cation channel subfamily A member 1 homolog isoform X3 [Ruditapes philippinarum]
MNSVAPVDDLDPITGADSGAEEADDTFPEGIVNPASYREPEEDLDGIKITFNLLQCARNNYVDAAQRLMKDEKCLKEINNEDEEGLTPLHYAARYNHFTIVKLLVENGADVNSEDREGLTPLHYACRIKRKRKKSKQTRLNLALSETMDNSPVRGMVSPLGGNDSDSSAETQVSLYGGRQIDPDASAIHYLIQHGAVITHQDDYGLTALHHAALRGDEVACQQLLLHATEEMPLIHAKDIQQMTPLHTACCQCESDIARQLILAGADIRCVDDEQSTPLHETATVGDTKILRVILESCKKGEQWDKSKLAEVLSDKDEDGNTPLMLAVESGRYKFAVNLINKGAAINTTNKWHMTPLHLAAIKGDIRIVKLLIEQGAKINALNHEHQSPLHKAALFNNEDCISCLLDNGANLESKDKDNFTPLLLAACYGHAKSVELLINRGADMSVEDKNDRTAVYLAAEEDQLDVLEVLLRHNKEKYMVNHRDECSNGPLHIASKLGHLRIVKCLLNNGADLFCKNDMEQTPIHMASVNGWTSVVREIVSKEKNTMSDGDEDSNTALHLAASGGHVKLVETLLSLGAEPEVRNSALRTPLACAAAQGYMKTVKVLAESDAMIDATDKVDMTPLLLASMNGHANVVDYLIVKKNADVTLRNLDGHNCLDLAVKEDHQDVAMEIVKSSSWKHALRNTVIEKGMVNTPLRRLIRKMPEVAEVVFDNCIEVNKPEDGSQAKLNHRHKVEFNFEFLDDLYSIHEWRKKRTNRRREKMKIKDTGKLEPEKEILDGFDWDKLKPFKPRDKELVPYTTESNIFLRNHPMNIMVASSSEELLDHPLVTALRRHKWVSFGRLFYYVSFVSYLIFLSFLTGYILVTLPPFAIDKSNFDSVDGDNDCEKYENTGHKEHTFAKIAKYVILVMDIIYIIKECVQAFHGRLGYINIENALEVSVFISSFLLVLDVKACQSQTGYRMPWQWNFGSISIVLAWIMLVLFIQKFPKLGIYVVMFRYILYTFFKFFLVFVLFIIAFGLGFFCLLQNQTPYSTAWNAIIRTSVMMIGEFDYNDIFHGEDDMHYWLTYVLFCAFLIVMTIIIMNLLVGLAVDDIKGVQDQATLKRIAMKVQLVLDIERINIKFTSRYYERCLVEYYDDYEEMQLAIRHSKEFEDQMHKSQQKMLKKVDKVKNTVKSLKNDISRLEDMLGTIMKAQDISMNTDDI